jgi:hypothetical protein
MRTPLFALTTIALISASCESVPMLTVLRVRPGDKVEPVRGDDVKIRRGPQETFAGVRSGFFVVRTTQDWQAMWSNAAKEQPMPPTLDTVRSMLLLAVADSKWTQELKVLKVLDTGTILDVWVRETKLGTGCEPKKTADASDAVVVDRLDKPVRFLVVEQSGEACGDPPIAQVKCRVAASATWATEVRAKPGDTIDCEMTAQSMGRFVVVDRALSLTDVPGGSAAKLAFEKGATRATFSVDVFGSYAIRAEATDEANRRGAAAARIVASPPKSHDVLAELVWTGFDPEDDPNTFPRVMLRAKDEVGDKDGPRMCTVDDPAPGFCEAKKHGAYTHMLLAAGDRRVPLSVLYADERAAKGPAACVQLWFDGQRTAESCDRKHRDADDAWDVGFVDLATGKLVESGTPPPTDVADAGAPDASGADASRAGAGAPSKAMPKKQAAPAEPKPAQPKPAQPKPAQPKKAAAAPATPKAK